MTRYRGGTFDRLALEDDAMAPDWCDECGARHSPERRRAIILRMLPAKAVDIAEGWPHLYPNYGKNSAAERMLFRDLRALHAFHIDGEWYPARRAA